MSIGQKRRRDVLFILLGIVAATLFLAALTRMTALFAVQVLADIALGGYVFLLVQHKQRVHERHAKVRFLGSEYRESTPSYARGSDSNGPRLVPLRQTVSN
jgi:hypothetical protein